MKIMILRPQFEAGGATKTIIYYVNGLIERGHDVILVSNGGDWLEQLRQGTRWYHVDLYPSTIKNFLRSIISINRIVRLENIEIINSHHRFSTMAANMAMFFRGVPIVSTVHEINRNFPFLSKLMFGKYSIVYSNAVKDHLIQVYKINKEAIKLLPIEVGDNLGSTNSNILDVKGIDQIDDSPIISCIARLSPEKGCFVLLDAIKIVIDKKYKARFLFIGDGPLLPDMKKKTIKYGLKSEVKYLGWQEKVDDYILLSDFLVLPSISEGLGLSIIEGWRLKKPTIASNVGGIVDLIKDGKTGVLVPAGNPEELAKGIIDLIEKPQKVKIMGENGYEVYCAQYRNNNHIKELESVFLNMIMNSAPK